MSRDLYEQFPYIETEDIMIRKMKKADTDSLFAVCSNKNVFKYIPEFLYAEDRELLKVAIWKVGEYDFAERRWIIAGVFRKIRNG